MRSIPQVTLSAHDMLGYARSQVEIELNGVGDNPIFFPDRNIQLSGANFDESRMGSRVSNSWRQSGRWISEKNEYHSDKGVKKAKDMIRKHVEFLDIDRSLYPDHTVMKEPVRSCEVLQEVEK